MTKLVAFIILAAIGFFVLPEVLATVAGILLVGGFVALILSGIGSLFSLLGSTLSTLLGVLFSLFSVLAVFVILTIGLPIFLAVMIPVGLVILFGGLCCSLICGIV